MIGRFAPSPTGPLHAGSLVTALASFLDARAQGGTWLVRMEDLDPPREEPGADSKILRALEALGLHWDGPVLYQSTRHAAYHDAIDQLRQKGLIYACTCSRRQINEAGLPGIEGVRYPGSCREAGHAKGAGAHGTTLRIRTDDTPVNFVDRIHGPCSQRLQSEIGDFILHRRDGLFAYQIAVVVDDAYQGVTDIVRGADLLDSTARQIFLQRALKMPAPRYLHVPLVTDASGDKLSKQRGAQPIDVRKGPQLLHDALGFLGQMPPDELAQASISDILDWGCANWQPARINKRQEHESS